MINKTFEYTSENGHSPFAHWFNKLDVQTAAKISLALYKIEQGYINNIKSLGNKLFEYKLYFGPGYRIYFAKVKIETVMLLVGGTKATQAKDIRKAKFYLNNYLQRKEMSHASNP